MVYVPTVYRNGQAPAYDSAEELNKTQQGIVEAHNLASKADSIVPYGFTKDPTTLQDYQIWRRTDFPTDEFRMFYKGQKYKVNLTNLLGASPIPAHFEGYVFQNGIRNVDFTTTHNNNSSGTSSSPENMTFVNWGSSFVELTRQVGTISVTNPTNSPSIRSVNLYDFSAIRSVEIDWEGSLTTPNDGQNTTDTDHPLTLSVDTGSSATTKKLTFATSFSRRISTLDVSNFFTSGHIYVAPEDNSSSSGRNAWIKVYSIRLIPM